MFAKAKDVC